MEQRMKRNSNTGTMLVFLTIVLMFVSSSVFGTNGYFRHGYGTHYRSLAGAGVALYLNSMGIANNPAGAVFLGSQLDAGFSIFSPLREYSVMGNPSGFPGTFPLAPGTVESDVKEFFIPYAGVNYALSGSARHAISLALYGNGGMNTKYPVKTFDNPQLEFDPPTGVDLSQLFINLTYAREIFPSHSIGISGILAWQRFKAEGLYAFGGLSSDPGKLTNNGHQSGTGVGLRVGYLGEWFPALSVGASFQTRIKMKKFSEYAGLFAEQGGFDIPANWVAGIAVKATPSLTLVADVQQVFYSDVKSIANPLDLQGNPPAFPDGSPNPDFQPLGSDNGYGFGWQDMTTVKLGIQWQAGSNTTLRGGFSFGEQPIPESEVLFNILAPGVIEQHLTFGFSQSISSNLDLNFALMHGLSNTVTGANPLEAPDQQQIELKMSQWEGDIGISWRF